jgi:hypothetical protein
VIAEAAKYIIKSISLDGANFLRHISSLGLFERESNLETSCIKNTSQKVGNVQCNTSRFQ